jgi:hypothetical protein
MEMEMERCAFTPYLSAWIAGFAECVLIFAMSIYIRRCFMCVRLDSVSIHNNNLSEQHLYRRHTFINTSFCATFSIDIIYGRGYHG